MERKTRINYTPEQKAIILDRYKQGDSLDDIARMFDRYHSSIMFIIRQVGGYRPTVQKRLRLVLSTDEIEGISRGLVVKRSIRYIADKLSRAPLAISREIKKHGGGKYYRAAKTGKEVWGDALRSKYFKLMKCPALCKFIAEKIHQDWSPEKLWLVGIQSFSHSVIQSFICSGNGFVTRNDLQNAYYKNREALKNSCSNALETEGQCVYSEYHC